MRGKTDGARQHASKHWTSRFVHHKMSTSRYANEHITWSKTIKRHHSAQPHERSLATSLIVIFVCRFDRVQRSSRHISMMSGWLSLRTVGKGSCRCGLGMAGRRSGGVKLTRGHSRHLSHTPAVSFVVHAGTAGSSKVSAGSSSQRQRAADWYIPVNGLLSHDVCPREAALVETAIALEESLLGRRCWSLARDPAVTC